VESASDEHATETRQPSARGARGFLPRACQRLDTRRRWPEIKIPFPQGAEAWLETLRLNSPELMEDMRRSKARKFRGEFHSPTAVILKPGVVQKMLAELAELGLLSAVRLDE